MNRTGLGKPGSNQEAEKMARALEIAPEVKTALAEGHPVVALESTLISHGLPAPDNLNCAMEAESRVRSGGGVPATIAVIEGTIRVGLDQGGLERLASVIEIAKLSRDDLGSAVARGVTGATTVAATMICARLAGIDVFATGGVGGVHRGWSESMDISADLTELSRTAVTVVCSGAKSILDLPATVEMLETLGVPLVGYRVSELPAFFSAQSGIELRQHIDEIGEMVEIIQARRQLEMGGGEILVVPPPSERALAGDQVRAWIEQALAEAKKQAISGKAVTPFLLRRLSTLSGGETLKTNVALILNNATTATELAVALAG
ncbi:MAG: pseudouridine-5'-phosphate glycosidase [Arenicellales bacterium]|nr:pseudouridine-5'-phosphate glycosidase [Arenicellales bacterium]